MTRFDDCLVFTPRITPTEAKMLVIAAWKCEPSESPRFRSIRGQVNGPFCEYSNTLPSRSKLEPDEPLTASNRIQAKATILEPCYWEPSHPFCYEIQLELWDDESVLLDM